MAAAPAQRRLVTVLFCDVVGSTTMAEQLDPEVLRAIFDEFTSLARAVIERHGGIVATFVGDGAVGLFGLTVAAENDTTHAAMAGIELLARLRNAKEAAAQGITLQARAAIETGEVIGDVGLAASGALAGDVLNTAARLQAIAEPGTLVAGPIALKMLSNHAHLRPMAPVILKGKAAPVQFAVVVSAAVGPRKLSESPFVGREAHLESFAQALRSVGDGRMPMCLTVIGDPGIGKSRLLHTFVSRLPADVVVLPAAVRPQGEAADLRPITDLISAALGDGTTRETADRLDELIEHRPDAAALGAALRSLLGQGAAGIVDHGWAFRRFLEELATSNCVVLIIDDLHWGSAALIDLIEDTMHRTSGPVLLLCAARPDLLVARESWMAGVLSAHIMSLGPLDGTESRSLADTLVGSRPARSALVAAAAEGNPLFVEQLAAELEHMGDAWDPTSVPTTIRALIEARLDRCLPEVARALSVAAIQGSVFDLDMVQHLWQETANLREVLAEAEHVHLARLLEPNVGTFAHALIRETAYHRLPKASRAELHSGLADMLDDDELVGTHLEHAARLREELGHPDRETQHRAGERLARAGNQAFARLDLLTTSRLLGRAERLLPTGSSTRLGMLPDLAVALMENGQIDQARKLLASAAVDDDTCEPTMENIRIRLQQLAFLVYADASEAEIRAGIAEGRSLLETLSHIDDDIGLAQGWVVLEYLHWLVGEVAAVEEAAGRSVIHAQRSERLREQVQAGGDQSIGLILGPFSARAIRKWAKGRSTSSNPVVAAGGYAGLAVAAALTDDLSSYVAAETRWRHAVDSNGLEWPGAQHAVMALAPILLEVGQPERAAALAHRGLETLDRLGDIWMLNGLPYVLSVALCRQGSVQEGLALAMKQNEHYLRMGTMDAIWRSLALSTACAAQGQTGQALVHAKQAAQAVRATDSNLHRSLVLEHLALCFRDVDPATAAATLHEVAAHNRAWENVPGSRRVAATLAEWTTLRP